MTQRKPGTWRFWPSGPGWALVTSGILLVVLVTAFFLLGKFAGWPGDALEPGVLIGVLIVSFVPVLLMLLEALAARGGSLGGFGFTVNFGAVAEAAAEQAPPGDVPRNMAAFEGLRIGDNGGPQVLHAIAVFGRNDVAVIDLEDGTAWWETRLAVVCAGARRLGSPRAIAFVATDAGRPRVFQGWAEPARMLDALASSDTSLRTALDKAAAVTARWDLAYPPQDAAQAPAMPTDLRPPDQKLAFEGLVRRSDAPEQILLNEMRKLESPQGQRTISIVRLHDLFGAFLHRETLDEALPEQHWLRMVFGTDGDYLAVTRSGRYLGLVARNRFLTDLFRSRLFPELGNDDRAHPEPEVNQPYRPSR
ncbi:hypothetical protein ACFRIB_01455 [Streptomyces mirabilis]|uniref:hypothetical protein n=1 Tax=Streptomyces mirabilis TaxID=68239 RepID=UPI0036AC3B3A